MIERARQREAFDRYFRLGPDRSLERLGEVLLNDTDGAPSMRTLSEWSRVFHWQQRIAEYEREAMRAEDAARIAALREMYERQGKEGLLLQQKGAEWLTNVDREVVSAEAAIRAIVEGAKLERLARGEPGERQAMREEDDDDGRYADLSTEELRAIAEAAERLVEGARPARPE